MLKPEVRVIDEVTQSAKYVEEIKEIYQKNILAENEIISAREYEECKKRLLQTYKEREKDAELYKEQIVAARELGLVIYI